jgi:hypothetical protein
MAPSAVVRCPPRGQLAESGRYISEFAAASRHYRTGRIRKWRRCGAGQREPRGRLEDEDIDMLIYFRDAQGDHLADLEALDAALADAGDEPADLVADMALHADVDLTGAEDGELAAMLHNCSRCPLRTTCRSHVASAAAGDYRRFCGNALLLDMIWVRAAVEGGSLADHCVAIERAA